MILIVPIFIVILKISIVITSHLQSGALPSCHRYHFSENDSSVKSNFLSETFPHRFSEKAIIFKCKVIGSHMLFFFLSVASAVLVRRSNFHEVVRISRICSHLYRLSGADFDLQRLISICRGLYSFGGVADKNFEGLISIFKGLYFISTWWGWLKRFHTSTVICSLRPLPPVNIQISRHSIWNLLFRS